ncbi:MAG: succinate dehydrogenase cytochrome b subunit [Alphaproteobacteria bacterium]|nr:succinate dehydrogenase cytochrome b subunit [Alphaproteobacteria bacterium]MCB9693400.1 succinate dehydrogenase cytochrome b subunit [Alphaproteobacteria bacterium]
MHAVLTLYRTTIGKKVVMAVTGTIMALWLVAHMAGNLQVFLGKEVFDHYAEFLQSQQEIIWPMRGFLLACIGLHVWSVVSLAATSRAARKTSYQGGKVNGASTLASKTLKVGGVFLLFFITWHLLDLTIGLPVVNPAFVRGHAYANLTASLARPGVGALYIVANIVLGMHLYHGIYSVFQTLGINQLGDRDTARMAGTALALVIAGGNILIATSIVLGIVGA